MFKVFPFAVGTFPFAVGTFSFAVGKFQFVSVVVRITVALRFPLEPFTNVPRPLPVDFGRLRCA